PGQDRPHPPRQRPAAHLRGLRQGARSTPRTPVALAGHEHGRDPTTENVVPGQTRITQLRDPTLELGRNGTAAVSLGVGRRRDQHVADLTGRRDLRSRPLRGLALDVFGRAEVGIPAQGSPAALLQLLAAGLARAAIVLRPRRTAATAPTLGARRGLALRVLRASTAVLRVLLPALPTRSLGTTTLLLAELIPQILLDARLPLSTLTRPSRGIAFLLGALGLLTLTVLCSRLITVLTRRRLALRALAGPAASLGRVGCLAALPAGLTPAGLL